MGKRVIPTPYGVVEIEQTTTSSGEIKTTYKGPEEVQIIR